MRHPLLYDSFACEVEAKKYGIKYPHITHESMQSAGLDSFGGSAHAGAYVVLPETIDEVKALWQQDLTRLRGDMKNKPSEEIDAAVADLKAFQQAAIMKPEFRSKFPDWEKLVSEPDMSQETYAKYADEKGWARPATDVETAKAAAYFDVAKKENNAHRVLPDGSTLEVKKQGRGNEFGDVINDSDVHKGLGE